MEIAQLIGALRRIGLETTFDDLRELFWLAGHIHAEPGRPATTRTESPAAVPALSAQPALPPAASPREEGDGKAGGIASAGDNGPAVELFADKPGAGAPARTIRVRGVPALVQSLAIGRALRPVLRRRPGHILVMDEQATAEHVAESGLGGVVYRPLRERWFDLVLISEQMASMAAWQPVLSEFERLLRRAGFRSVRSMQLETDSMGLVSLRVDGRAATARSVRDRTGRTLALVLSDCTSAAWNDGRVGAWMASLAAEVPLAVAQYLPQSLWPNTAVGFAELRVRAAMLGARTGQLHVRRPSWALDEPGVVLPVFALTPSMIHSWARMTVGAGNAWSTAALMPLPDEGAGIVPASVPAVPVLADDRLNRFRAFAGRDAQLLAAYCSAVRPLTPPVMRVIHRAMTPESGSVALAQVLLGGLLFPLAATAEVRRDPDDVEYEFYPGLREVLSRTLTERDVIRVNMGLHDYLVELSGTPFDFFALLADTGGSERLPEAALPFARFAREQFRRFAGSAVAAAQRGRSRLAVNILDIRRWPDGFVFRYSAAASEQEWRHPVRGATEELFDALTEQVVREGDWRRGAEMVNRLFPADLLARLDSVLDDSLCELVLDHASAKYPWEFLLSMPDEEHGSVARRRGFTRRLAGMRKKKPATAAPGPALVIGFDGGGSHPFGESGVDSITAQALRDLSGGDIHFADAASAHEALARRPWRILHIVQTDPRSGAPEMRGPGMDRSGFHEIMDLIGAIKRAPELVFIDHKAAGDAAPHLVERGAAVVIAAPGHAGDIETADFAATFYKHLYMGESLIEAVRSARQSTTISLGMDAAGTQCYGRPDWRFIPAEQAAGESTQAPANQSAPGSSTSGAPRADPVAPPSRPLSVLFTGVSEQVDWLAGAIRKEFQARSDLVFRFLPSNASPSELNALFRTSRPSLAMWDAVVCVLGAEPRGKVWATRTVSGAPSAQQAVYDEALKQGKPVFGFIRDPDPREALDAWVAPGPADILFANRLAREQSVVQLQTRGELVGAVLRCIHDLRREFDAAGLIASKAPSTAQSGAGNLPEGLRWILVAGSGSKNKLSKKLFDTSERLGAALARAGFGLITGGWRGVDEAVARRFVAELSSMDIPAETRQLQVVPVHKTPRVSGGAVLAVEKGVDEYEECVKRASYLIMLGGNGGTEMAAHFALQADCTVLPLADTGGDARRIHAQIQKQAPHERQRFVTDKLLLALQESGPQVGESVVRLIEELEQKRRPQP